jgi:tetratricopeptide (TPR) repeat protein
MHRAFLAASVIALLPASVFAYINAGFKSQVEYNRHMREQREAKIGRATEAIRRNPKDAVAYLYRGNIYADFHSGWREYSNGGPNYEEALADYSKAIELDPKLAEAYFQRGRVHYELFWQEWMASPAVQEADKLPNGPVRIQRFRELEKKPQPKKVKALADVEKAIQLNPKLLKAQVFFAVYTKDAVRAIQAAKQACELTEYKEEVCVELMAACYARSGDFDNAVHWQEKALKLKFFPEFYRDWARERLEKYRQKKPNDWDVPFWQRMKERK